MRTVVQDKYFLRDLHREIDLYDRKLTHLRTHEAFATDAERDAAAKKLVTKRDTLAATARALAVQGVEFDAADLPRSFRPAAEASEAHATDSEPVQVIDAASLPDEAATMTSRTDDSLTSMLKRPALREEESALASALGSWKDDLLAYKKRRQKAVTA